jgi:hypothetical protein
MAGLCKSYSSGSSTARYDAVVAGSRPILTPAWAFLDRREDMKIWISYEGANTDMLRAIAGGVSSSVPLDCLEILDSVTGSISQQIEDTGLVPVMRVTSPLAMKREFGGLAIIVQQEGDATIKTKHDVKTLLFKMDDSKTRADKALEKILEFLKTNKVKSPL